MQRLMIAGLVLLASAAVGRAQGMFWVVGNHATGKCEIVTSNPVIAGNVWFGDGPYKSKSDAKLARSTISACPKTPDDEDKQGGGDVKN